MSSRYDDRDNERNRRNYGRRSGSEYDRYGQSSQGGAGRMFDDESERYSGEDRWRGQFGSGGSEPWKEGGDYQTARGGESRGEFSSGGWADSDYSSERNRGYGRSGGGRGGYGGGRSSEYSGGEYSGGGRSSSGGYGGGEYGGGSGRYSTGGRYSSGGGEYGGGSRGRGYSGGEYSSGGRGYGGSDWRSSDSSSGYSQRYNYPGGYRSGESERYGRGSDYERGGYGEGQERGWWDRASDEVASWFGDEEAERRRRMDAQRPYRGRGPKGYKRSDERIKEDVNDRLSEGYIDATEIDVAVQGGEVTLTGTVNSRYDKRRAEDIAEDVSGVTNVENRIRVRDRSAGSYPTSTVGTYGSPETGGMTGTTGATGATGTGTTGTTGTSSSAGTSSSGGARGKSAGGGGT